MPLPREEGYGRSRDIVMIRGNLVVTIGSSLVPSDERDIEKAHRRHLAAAQVQALSRRIRLMLLFYAAETGLKRLYIHHWSASDASEIRPRLAAENGLPFAKVNDHNLEMLCTAVAIGPADVGTPRASFSLSIAPHSQYSKYKVHETARYGTTLDTAYLTTVEVWLQRICAVVGARISQGG